jgi:hypothetical protein
LKLGIVRDVTNGEPSSGKSWSYRFTQPGGPEVETSQFNADAAAETRGRELSKLHDTPIVIHRHSAHVDGWEYVTEVDERS